ncbi:hypothetical protein AHMF7605_11640 [Adhaeribacter arboris]|uniref:Uncharacterized protein n=1 Tax=Adhaeribacter arboris TaxID=2072846 RepID=A0A2T2YF46_9BACT|nr:hypothetical protein [Adhaeribacter arboris]PSR54124.1 hypothetical protein AHMF7605_11640 [Adhaeribacter arboris]
MRYQGKQVRITAIKDLTKEKLIQHKLEEDVINSVNQLETRDNLSAAAEIKQNLLVRLRKEPDGK